MDTTRLAIETTLILTTTTDVRTLPSEPTFEDRRPLFGNIAIQGATLGTALVERHGMKPEEAVEAIRSAVACGALGVSSGEGGPFLVPTVPSDATAEQFANARRWALGLLREARNVRAAA